MELNYSCLVLCVCSIPKQKAVSLSDLCSGTALKTLCWQVSRPTSEHMLFMLCGDQSCDGRR